MVVRYSHSLHPPPSQSLRISQAVMELVEDSSVKKIKAAHPAKGANDYDPFDGQCKEIPARHHQAKRIL